MTLGKQKSVIFAGAFASAIALMAGMAHAQEDTSDAVSEATDDTDAVNRLGKIIVQARKREENLQDEPISITALGKDELRDANVFSLEDVAQLTPGVTFRNESGLGEINIRGLAQTDIAGLQSNVGVFIDGVFLNNRSSLDFGNMDLAQIEVLKGPQSALFGRNTFAGAVNYITNPARIGEFDATVEAEVGTDDLYGIKGTINLPLGDVAALRIFGTLGVDRDSMRVVVHVAVPRPNEVDVEAIAALLPYGTVEVMPERGGMDVSVAGDVAVMAVAAIEVFLPARD